MMRSGQQPGIVAGCVVVAFGALALSGCASLVWPSTRIEWGHRINEVEATVSTARKDLEKLTRISNTNEGRWMLAAASAYLWSATDIADTQRGLETRRAAALESAADLQRAGRELTYLEEEIRGSI